MAINTITPKSRDLLTKLGQVTRSDTTAVALFGIPKDAVIAGVYVIGSAVSNAGTSATIGVGSSASANEYMTGFDVAGATGEGYHPAGAAAVGSALASKLSSDAVVYGLYAESGTASTSGGPWTVKVEYFVTGPGETL